MKEIKVTCDGCGKDLTTRTNIVDYRLVLESESKPSDGSDAAYTSMAIYPPIDRTHHFCGLVCLDLWRSREHHWVASWEEWWSIWRTEHATKHRSGIVSCPVPPSELQETRNAEFRAAALKAFPMSKAII